MAGVKTDRPNIVYTIVLMLVFDLKNTTTFVSLYAYSWKSYQQGELPNVAES